MEASRRVPVDGHLLGLAGAAAGFALFPAIVGRGPGEPQEVPVDRQTPGRLHITGSPAVPGA